MRSSSLEVLEPRIAPATLTGRLLKYVDVDGDLVTITFTKGTLVADNFTFNSAFGFAGMQQLQRINLVPAEGVDGTNIVVTVKRGPEGNGTAHIGEILAAGRDLGIVSTAGDIGKIGAGDAVSTTPAIKSLTIGSYGAFDGATQPAGSNQSSIVTGNVPTN
jgi:hypothetical protein